MGKRAAGVPAGAAWKKQRGTGPRAKINTIIAALKDSELSSEAPEVSRVMLADGAATALASVVEERHPMQETIMGYIKEVLVDMSARLAEQVEEAKRASSTAESELELHKAQVKIATDELEEAKGAIAAKEAGLETSKQALKEREEAIATSDSDQKVLTREKNELEKEQTKFKDLDEGTLKALLEQGPAAGGSEKEAKKSCDKLIKEFGKLGAEPALLAAAPPVLMKVPQDRAGFDSHVLESLKAILAERLEEVAKRLEANAAAVAAMAPDVAARAEAGEKARAAFDAAQAELDAAEGTVSDKQVALVVANTQLEVSEKAVQEKRDAITVSLQEVEAFSEVLACYDFLAARSSAPAAEEAAEPEEAKEAEAEAAAPAVAAA